MTSRTEDHGAGTPGPGRTGEPPATRGALDHCATARGSPVLYFVLAVGALFVWAALAIDPDVTCREYPCPVWLRGTIFALGVLFGGGAALAILRDIEWGSRLDDEAGAIVWWHGRPGTRRHRIPVATVGSIEVHDGDSVHVQLRDREGRRIYLPTDCVPAPAAEWAAEMSRRYPHIRVSIID